MPHTRASLIVASLTSLFASMAGRSAANESKPATAPTPTAAPTGILADLGFTKDGSFPESLTLVRLETDDDHTHPIKLRLQARDDLADAQLGAILNADSLTIDASGLSLVLETLWLEAADEVSAKGGFGPFYFNGRAKSMRLVIHGPSA